MISAFTRLDLSSWFPRMQVALTLLFVVAIGVLLPVPGMAIMTAAIVASLMVSAPFLGDERGRLDTLYGVLPVSRSTVVIGRALSIICYYLVAATIATIVTIISAVLTGGHVDTELLLVAHSIALAFIGVSMAFQLPVLFRIGYSRGRLMAYAPVFVIVGLAWLLQAVGADEGFSAAFEAFPVGALVAIGALIGVIGIICAIAVSARLYRTRQL